MLSTEAVYKANLQRVGTAIPETIALLSKYFCVKDWEQVKASAQTENLLKKRSSHTVDGLLRVVYQRFFAELDPLPNAEMVAKAMTKDVSLVSKTQILYIYTCLSDKLVEKIILDLVNPKLDGFDSHLSKEDVQIFLDKEGQHHPELRNWSGYLKQRWTRGFLALLRDFGVMQPTPSNRLLKPIIRTEAFAFFVLGLLDGEISAFEILRHHIWDLYFLRETDIDNLLIDMQAKGWLHYLKASHIVEMKPKYKSLEEWLDAGLG